MKLQHQVLSTENKDIVQRNYEVEMKGKYIPEPQKWTEQEINMLMWIWPKHIERMRGFDVAHLRAQFKNRSYVAIRKKAWSILGNTKMEESIDQMKMDFAQEKIGYKK